MDDVLKQIETAMNNIIAEQRAHQVVLLGLVGQVAGMANDWRERLSVMRGVAEKGVKAFEFTNVDGSDNEPIREKMNFHVTELYEEVGRSLAQWEASGRPNPYTSG
jgi:hypothetical protein